MSGPRRITLSRAKGWRMPPHTVKVDRSSVWGNPFAIGVSRCSGHGMAYVEEPVKDAETAVRFFCEMLEYERRPYPTTAEIIEHLRGKNLACWCKPGQPCHADVLLRVANKGGAA